MISLLTWPTAQAWFHNYLHKRTNNPQEHAKTLQKYIIVFNSASYCNLILCGYFFQLEQKILIWCALEGPVLENNWIKFVGPSISDH